MGSKINNTIEKMLGVSPEKLLKGGDARSIKAIKHIFFSFGIRGVSAVLSFVMVPIILNFLGAEQYGVWVTLWTIIAWFNVLDLGFGNGLRNNFAISIANNEHKQAKQYVSTAYIGIISISIIITIIFLLIYKFISWEKILNSPAYLDTEVPDLVLIVFVFFILSFITKLIGTVLLADQRAALNNSIIPVANILSLAIIIFVIHFNPDRKLIAIGTAISATPFLVYFIYSLIFYNTRYKQYRPSFKYFDRNKLRGLMSLGLQFFLIQLSVIIISFTDNLIIAQILGPKYVTPYSNAHRLFFFVYTPLFVTILSTLWSAFTDAYARDDIQWIKAVISKLRKLWVLITIFTIILVVFSKQIFTLWLGESSASDIPLSLSIFMGLFIIIHSWTNIYAYVINGIGKVKFMLYGNVVAASLNIPLSVFLGRNMELGITGVILATVITQITFAFALPYQVNKILKKEAKGIWNK